MLLDCVLPSLLPFLLLHYVRHISSQKLLQFPLSTLWKNRSVDGIHLFPTLTSTVYPEFAGFKKDSGSSRIHLSADEVMRYKSEQTNGTQIKSVCSYSYLGTVFYVVNLNAASNNMIDISLNLTMTELELVTEEMLMKRMNPAHICRGPGGKFQAVWQGSSEEMQHYIVQEGEIKTILREDVKHGREGYYPTSMQVYRERNQTTALIVWEKGFGVRYRIQSGSNLREMGLEMNGTMMQPHQITAISGKALGFSPRYYVVWHSDDFTWAGKDIPRTTLLESTPFNFTELDFAVEMQMRLSDIPSMSLCVYKKGKRLLSAAYGFSDLRSETKANPTNSYRIASISKTITAMGIAELINRRLVSLEDRVFGVKGALYMFDIRRAHPWLQYVTVRHLLEHSSGGWSSLEKIEFNRTPQTKQLNGTTLIDFYIKSYDPKFQPGTRYSYSNIGYVMLGRIIEQISSRPYSEFIQDVILKPNNIEARIGEVEPKDTEVSYYSPDNANPYTYWTPSKLDAAAGWVMRPEEVVRLFLLVESAKFSRYQILTQRSFVKRNYGRGLQLGDDGSLYHLGSLAGSEGIGFSSWDTQVAIFINMRGREQGEQTAWMERLCRLIVKRSNTHF